MKLVFDLAWTTGAILTLIVTGIHGWFISRLSVEQPALYRTIGEPGYFYFLVGGWIGVSRYMRALVSGSLADELGEKPQLRRISIMISVLTVVLVGSWFVGLTSLLLMHYE